MSTASNLFSLFAAAPRNTLIPSVDTIIEKIENALADALKVRYAYVEDENASENHITVKKERLNCAKINVKDVFNEYRIAPAWFFCDENDKVVRILNATDMSMLAS